MSTNLTDCADCTRLPIAAHAVVTKLEPSYFVAASNCLTWHTISQLCVSLCVWLQGLHHLQQAMASHIHMKGVSFHEFQVQKDQLETAAPAIQNDVVSIIPVVLAELPNTQEAQEADDLSSQPNKRQRTAPQNGQAKVYHFHFVTTACLVKQTASVSECPCSKTPLQSCCSNLVSTAVSLLEECPYIWCP